jgi:mono/diheme cytochrome c family protein
VRVCAAALASALGLVVAGCGGSEASKPVAQPGEGRRVLVASGCLACHQLGSDGSSGPGNSLTGIGARRTRAQIRRAIVSPALSPGGAPAMPAYEDLPEPMLDALVAYLAAQREAPGGPACDEGADCG